MIKALLIGDYEPDLQTIHSVLFFQADIQIMGWAGSGYQGLEMAKMLQPDLVIISLINDDIDGPDFMPLLKRRAPGAQGILYTGRQDDEYVYRALGNGISGYLLKHIDLDKFPLCVRIVHNGGSYVNPRVFTKASGVIREMVQYRTLLYNIISLKRRVTPLPGSLSRQELQIMGCVGLGISNNEIAKRLRLNPGTIRNYLCSAMRKAGLKNRVEVALFAIRHGLTDFWLSDPGAAETGTSLRITYTSKQNKTAPTGLQF
jgi:DNA-binding NarL/FixJ family response regulator